MGAPRPGTSLARRVAYRALKIIGALLSLTIVLVLFAGTLAFVPSVQEKIVRLVLRQLNSSVVGHLEVGSLRLWADGRIHATRVRVLDATGAPVATLDELSAQLRPLSILGHRIELRRASLVHPVLSWIITPTGSTLTDAFAPKQAKLASPRASQTAPAGPSPWTLAVDGLELREGRVEVVPSSGTGLLVDGIDLQATVHDGPGQVLAKLQGKAAMHQPEEAPVDIDVDLDGTGLSPAGQLTLRRLVARMGSSSVEMTGSEQAGTFAVDLHALVRATLAQSLGVPLRRDLAVEGHGTWDGTAAHASASIAGPNSPVNVTAFVHPDSAATQIKASVELSKLDPQEWITGAPNGSITGRVTAESSLVSSQPFEADVGLVLGESRVASARCESVRGRAHLTGTDVTLQELTLNLAGATVRASGQVSPENLDLTADAELASLAKLTSMLGVEGWSGAGNIAARISGATRDPHVDANVALAQLNGPSLQLRNLTVKAETRPLQAIPRVTATITADRGRVGQRPVTDIRGEVQIDPLTFRVDVSSRVAPLLRLKAAGRFGGPSQVDLDNFEVNLEPYRWVLEHPAVLDLRRGFHTDEIRLRSEDQLIAMSGGIEGSRLDARVQLRGVRLDQIPSLFAPSGSALAGRVSAEIHAAGTPSEPRVEGSLSGQGLGFREVQNGALEVTGAVAGGHVQATANLVTEAGKIDASITSTLKELQQGALSANVHASGINLPKLTRLLAKTVPSARVPALEGTASLDLDVDGEMTKPTGSLKLQLEQVAGLGAPPVSGQLTAHFDQEATLDVDLHSARLKLTGHGEISLPPGPLNSPQIAERIQQEPFSGNLKASGFYLEDWRTLLRLPPDASGEVDLVLQGQGTLAQPEGSFTATSASALIASGYHLSWAKADLHVDSTRVQASCDLAAATHSSLHLEAAVESGLQRLIAQRDLAHVSVSVKATGDGHLEALAVAPGPQGHVTVQVEGQGTLGAPVVHAEVVADGVKLSRTAMPETHLKADYAAGHASAEVHASTLDLTVSANQAVGYGVALPPDMKAIPFEMHLHSAGYDLSALAGLTPNLETLEGILDADVVAQGSLHAPQVKGKADLTKGRVVWASVGDFQDIDLHAQVSNELLQLTNLDVRSGDGKLHLDGRGGRLGSGAYALTGHFSSEKFPVLYDDQLLVLAGAQSTLSGTLGASDSLVEVHFQSIHLVVPSLTHRKLQSLDPNPHIAVLRSGNTLAFAPGPALGSISPSPPAPPTAHAAPVARPLRLRIGLFAPADFWVKGADMDLDLRASMGLELSDGLQIINPPGTTEQSTVELMRGHLDVFGRRFDVPDSRPSKLTFEGGDPTFAHLDVQMLYIDAIDNVTVTLSVTGPLLNPNPPVMSSVPALDSTTLAMLLATGHLQTKRSSGGFSPSNEAASLLGSVLAGQVQKTLSAHLPIDTLTITTSDQGVKVETGVYLTSISDRLYLGYTHNVITGTETDLVNINELGVQFQLSRYWDLKATGGDAAKGGFDAMWTKDY